MPGVVAAALKVRTEVPEPLTIEGGTNAHVGGGVTTGAMLHVKATALLKLLIGAMVTVEVADAPTATDAGESVEAAIVKSPAGGAVTVRLPDVE